ncbi:GntR family transcriptional regulator [Streptomyces sp. Wh19]|uniref:GntR family transcriptional regulator n=1 Tax=Streptomyces sp. Wh19 TaxID=3076629 RepID=UPI0029583C95|nr:GntR family transcriptional regulator [Streptomyces sp. Wh19]MDV9194571.1 GntR family transcriptional regulator [Streptomyces sp. Wh19]
MTGLNDLLEQNRGMASSGLLSDRVYRLLRSAILSGEMVPDQRIVESDIAKRLGISQAPVREAVKRLVYESLVTHVPRLGSRVAHISTEQAEQARELRGQLEEFAARSAAQRRAEGYVDQLNAVVDDMRRAARQDDPISFRDSDMTFHRLVCQASGNHLLPRLWEVMEPSLWALRVVSDPFYTGSRDKLVNEHARLLDMLVGGREDDAARAFRLHAIGAARLAQRDE